MSLLAYLPIPPTVYGNFFSCSVRIWQMWAGRGACTSLEGVPTLKCFPTPEDLKVV